jgi:hypothetical protein
VNADVHASRRSRSGAVAVRLILAHALAYPVAVAWALGAIPFVVVHLASRAGTPLDDKTVAALVLVRVAWPAIGAFVTVHAMGCVWVLSRDEERGRRLFIGVTALLVLIAVSVGGASWLWLMER